MTDRSVTFVIPGIWQRMREMREEVRALVADYGSGAQNGAVVAANELVENAIKYGAAVPKMPDVQLNLDLDGDELTVRVSNGYDDRDSVERLKGRLEELDAGTDPLELFIARLDEVSRAKDETMGLGIYRVAAEGGFSLEAEISDQVVTVVARRKLGE